jgi:hypothetical protein
MRNNTSYYNHSVSYLKMVNHMRNLNIWLRVRQEIRNVASSAATASGKGRDGAPAFSLIYGSQTRKNRSANCKCTV